MKAFLFSRWHLLIVALLPFWMSAVNAGPEMAAYQASKDPDGVQRVNIIGGSYFFRPDHVIVEAGQPLEIAVKAEAGVVPHSFVLEAADGKTLIDVSLGEEAKILRLNLPIGNYVFYCAKRLLGFKSHRERGMAGVLEAKE